METIYPKIFKTKQNLITKNPKRTYNTNKVFDSVSKNGISRNNSKVSTIKIIKKEKYFKIYLPNLSSATHRNNILLINKTSLEMYSSLTELLSITN